MNFTDYHFWFNFLGGWASKPGWHRRSNLSVSPSKLLGICRRWSAWMAMGLRLHCKPCKFFGSYFNATFNYAFHIEKESCLCQLLTRMSSLIVKFTTFFLSGFVSNLLLTCFYLFFKTLNLISESLNNPVCLHMI